MKNEEPHTHILLWSFITFPSARRGIPDSLNPEVGKHWSKCRATLQQYNYLRRAGCWESSSTFLKALLTRSLVPWMSFNSRDLPDLVNLAIGSSGSASYFDIRRSYRPALVLDSYLQGEKSLESRLLTFSAELTRSRPRHTAADHLE